MQQRQRLLALALVAFALVGTTLVYAALPTAPNSITEGQSSTFNPANYAPVAVNAYAGNITALVITGLGQTKAWQGYYGNITGSITLDDANNFTFYNWTSTEPRGQVYATLNNSISWVNVTCLNFTSNVTNITTMDSYYVIQSTDGDDIDVTFNQTNHPTFQVGAVSMAGCPTTYVFQNDAYQQANFVNVLLWDQTNTATGWIYTTLVENKTAGSTNDMICYNGQSCDFQILVNENGHGTDTSPTPYYFWVELV